MTQTASSAPPAAGEAVTVRRIPDPGEPVPRLARPTAALCAGALAAWVAAIWLAVSGTWPWALTVVVNSAVGFAMFTVAHEAIHHTISSRSNVNTWLGRLAMPFFAPHGSFGSFRFIHMQHHRYTNAGDGRDPDYGTSHSSGWTAPLRWFTLDFSYWFFYLPKLLSRPRRERLGLYASLAATGAVVATLIATGHGVEMLVLWYLPVRLAVGFLGWSFDYLPHHDLEVVSASDRFKTTRNRIGAERLLTPLMLYQNYHLVHHLHPRIPFHRYIAVWRRNEGEYLDRDPELVDVRGRAITPDEYRRLRELDAHHHD